MTSTCCEQCGAAASSPGAFCEHCDNPPARSTVAVAAAQSSAEAAAALPASGRYGAEPAADSAALRGVSTSHRGRRSRSKAWVYYMILAVLSLVALCAGHLAGLAGMALFGLYSLYLYRGGRIVFWFW